MKKIKKIIAILLMTSIIFTSNGMCILANNLDSIISNTIKAENEQAILVEEQNNQNEQTENDGSEIEDAENEDNENGEDKDENTENENGEDKDENAENEKDENKENKNESEGKDNNEVVVNENKDNEDNEDKSKDAENEDSENNFLNIATESEPMDEDAFISIENEPTDDSDFIATKSETTDESVFPATESKTTVESTFLATESETTNESTSLATKSETTNESTFLATKSETTNESISLATESETTANNIFIATTSEMPDDFTLLGNGHIATNNEIEKTEEKYPLGNIDSKYIPPTIDENFNGLFGAGPELPTSYDSRDYNTNGLNYIPPIRSQSPYGICWAFSTLGMMETSIRKKGLVTNDENSNLSELALAYFMFNLKNVTNKPNYDNLNNIAGNDYTIINEEYFRNIGKLDKATWSQCGGNLTMSTQMLSAYVGSVTEDENTVFSDNGDRNQAMTNAENNGLPLNYAFNKNSFVINNVQYINRTNKNLIKKAIMENGSVGFSYFSESTETPYYAYSYHKEADGESYYHSDNKVDNLGNPITNHAIMIIGWDDSIQAEHFYYGTNYATSTSKSTGNGAWLCRNSWGDNTSFLNDGYFWIPYDEPSLSYAFYTIDAIKADTYKYNYHYDTTATEISYTTPYGMNTVYGNIYKVAGEDEFQTLDAVNVSINATNAEYDISIYTNPSPMQNPMDGNLITTKRCSNITAGIYTFELDEKVPLIKDTYYSIVISPISANNNLFELFIDTIDELPGFYYTYNENKPKQSYYMNATSNNWYDFSSDNVTIDGKTYGSNFRIKGLANPGVSITFDANGGEGIMANQIIRVNTSTPLNKNLFEKPGYKFVKWISNTSEEYFDGDDITLNAPVTLAAEWEIVDYIFTQDWYDPILSGMEKTEITSIKFLMAPTASPSDVDASWEIDGSNGLIASRKESDIIIYAPYISISGKIGLPEDSSMLFAGRIYDEYTESYELDFENIFAKCERIENLNLLDTSNVNNMNQMFYGLGSGNIYDDEWELLADPTPVSIDISSFDTHNVISMTNMFDTSAIRNIDISNLDTSNLTDVYGMFNGCILLQNIDLSHFQTATISNASYMFYGCESLTNINLNGTTFENAFDMSYMFSTCTSLEELDLSTFKTQNVTIMQGMFENCSNLRTIIASKKFNTDNVSESSDMFLGCEALTGENNTTYIDTNLNDKTYARVDGRNNLPGYFTSTTSIDVIFDYNGKGNNFSEAYEKGDYIVKPNNPIWPGYTFVHWYEEGSNENSPYDFTPMLVEISVSTKRLIAKWAPIKYTISYNIIDNSFATKPANIVNHEYGTNITLTNPSNVQDGYRFAGWFTNLDYDESHRYVGGNNNELATTSESTATLYAKWEIRTRYNANGHGTAPVATWSEYNKNIILPSIANVKGFSFDSTNSWYDGSNTSTATFIGSAGSEYTVNAPKDLYAKWNENNYTINYNRDGGNWVNGYDPTVAGVTSRKYTEEKTLPKSLNITKTGYTFLGWYKEGDTTKTVISKISANTNESVTVVAKWSENIYNITLNKNNGTYVSGYEEPTTRKYTDTTPLPTNNNIKKTGYRLGGWYEHSNYSGTAVIEVAANTATDKTFYAKWVPETYNVTLHVNGGTINSENVTSYTYGIDTTLPTDVTKANNLFKGWWTQNGAGGNWGSQITAISTTDIGEKTYYAKWANSYIVTFDLTSGPTHPNIDNITNIPLEQNIESGTIVIRPQIPPQAANYEFIGWYDSTFTNEYDFSRPIIATTTIYAKWNNAITHEVSFNLLSGSVHPAALADILNIPDTQHIVNDRTITKPINPTATGYSFAGWYTDATFATTWNFTNNAVSESKILYGKWDEISYNIIYHENGGEYINNYAKPTSRLYTESKTLPTNIEISKHNYEFDGWYESNIYEGVAITEVATRTARDITIYAKWSPVVGARIITFYDGYSEATAEQAFIYGEDTTLKTNIFTRSGWTFIRWKDNAGNVITNTKQLTDNDISLFAEWQQNPIPSNNSTNYDSRRIRNSGGGGGGGGGGRGSGALNMNMNNNATQTILSIIKSNETIVNSDSVNWIYDPITDKWKLSIFTLSGIPTTAKGFIIINTITELTENNVSIPKLISNTYCFSEEGNMITGWVKTIDNKWYFFENAKTIDEGKLVIGWKQIDNDWYFFDSDGIMLSNTTTADGYILDASGKWLQ